MSQNAIKTLGLFVAMGVGLGACGGDKGSDPGPVTNPNIGTGGTKTEVVSARDTLFIEVSKIKTTFVGTTRLSDDEPLTYVGVMEDIPASFVEGGILILSTNRVVPVHTAFVGLDKGTISADRRNVLGGADITSEGGKIVKNSFGVVITPRAPALVFTTDKNETATKVEKTTYKAFKIVAQEMSGQTTLMPRTTIDRFAQDNYSIHNKEEFDKYQSKLDGQHPTFRRIDTPKGQQ